MPEEDWEPAVEADGERRAGAYVVELTSLVNLAGWPEGCRLIVRRERPHPGAQLSLFDTQEGWRHTAFITGTPARRGDIAALELRHRQHARVEDRIRVWKDTGLANLPFESYTRNQAWLALTQTAQCLLAWCRTLSVDGLLARAEPKTLRQRLLHVAARLAHHAGRLHLRIDTHLALGARPRPRLHPAPPHPARPLTSPQPDQHQARQPAAAHVRVAPSRPGTSAARRHDPRPPLTSSQTGPEAERNFEASPNAVLLRPGRGCSCSRPRDQPAAAVWQTVRMSVSEVDRVVHATSVEGDWLTVRLGGICPASVRSGR